jgi:hypothetical protein
LLSTFQCYLSAAIRGFCFSLSLAPGISIPLGEDSEIFTLGGGTNIAARLDFPLLSKLDINAIFGLGYDFTPVKADTSLSTLSIGAGGGITWEFIPRLRIGGYAKGGYFYSLLNDTSGVPEGEDKTGGGNLFLSGGVNFAFRLFPTVSIGVDASYRNLLALNKSIIVALAASYHFKTGPVIIERVGPFKDLDLYDIEFETLFPVFFKYYDDHIIGRAVLHNTGESPIEDIKVNFFVEEYMVNPKLCSAPQKLKPGQEGDVEFYGLFTDKVLDISESTKVSARITVECTMNGKEYRNEYIETIRLHDRNAITWDDDRKAAAFVTMKDPTVLRFAKSVAGAVKNKVGRAINSNLLMAIAMHEALTIYGMSYVVDPSTPYKEFSRKELSLDYLQFPKQSLEYKAGDCDDLSILYSALLESVGVETAFITVPGHIYMAFSLNMLHSEAKKQFLMSEDLIFIDQKIWLPVEVTEISGGFLKAWETGAKEWREYEPKPKGQAGLYPLCMNPGRCMSLSAFQEKLSLFPCPTRRNW